ncbi:MAG: DUF58 domain-containing protein, partial [Phycisphaeraceae bacterium]
AQLSRMELVARHAVEGFLTGKHPSPFHGSSVEYADHRPYTLGDEIRSLDWKLLAKTDKHYVKLYEDQTNIRCTILLDTSRSMAFHSEDSMSKLEYGAHVAAALGYLMLRQNDAVGLALFDRALREYLPARSTASHFRRMMDMLEHAHAQRDSDMGPAMHELAGRLQRRGMIVLISDLIDAHDALKTALGHFRHRKHDVIVFHVMDPHELDFPYERLTRFKDMEGAGTVVTNPANVRRHYLQRLDEFLKRTKAACLERGVSYELLRTDQPWNQALSAYLGKRSKMR